MSMMELVTRAAQPTVSMRATIPIERLKGFVGQAFGAAIGYIHEMGAEVADMPFNCYRSLDLQALDVEAGVPVSRSLPGRGDLLGGEIPAGQYAARIHIGGYDSLPATYEALARWVAEQGLKMAGPAYEFYYSEEGVPPEHTVTRVLFLLQP